jgi:hypothetical protein
MQLTAGQLRAARALLDLDEIEVAARAQVPLGTVMYIEASEFLGTLPSHEVNALRLVFEDDGVEFIEDGARWRWGRAGEPEFR